MSFRRLRPVQSLKHIVDTNGGILGGSPSTTDVVNAVDAPVIASPNNVQQGCKVHAIFLNVQVVMDTKGGGINNIYMIVYKNPGGNVTAPAVDAVGVSDKRKFVLHQEMLMLSNEHVTVTQFAVPRTLFKGVVRIPPRLNRFGYNDKLQVVIGHRNAEATQKSDFCLESVYKEFR